MNTAASELDTPEQRAAMAVLRGRWANDGCKPSYRGSQRLATPGEARAAEQGYADYPRFIGPDSVSYRVGWLAAEAHAEKRAAIAEDARGEDLWLARGGSGE